MEAMYIALTFDDGPNTTTTMQVLDVLEKHGIVASFFLIGDNIDDNSAKSVKRAYDSTDYHHSRTADHNHAKSRNKGGRTRGSNVHSPYI